MLRLVEGVCVLRGNPGFYNDFLFFSLLIFIFFFCFFCLYFSFLLLLVLLVLPLPFLSSSASFFPSFIFLFYLYFLGFKNDHSQETQVSLHFCLLGKNLKKARIFHLTFLPFNHLVGRQAEEGRS